MSQIQIIRRYGKEASTSALTTTISWLKMAAAATVINAVPREIPCTLWIDSTATIQAIKKGVTLSERKLLRSSGRIWLNWVRPLLPSHIDIKHVRSHRDVKGPAEIGNDAADALANKFRLHGKKAAPALPCLQWEEPFYCLANGNVVQGDIRTWSKKNEQEQLLKAWSRCTSQFRWMRKNRRQITRMAEEVWTWVVETGDGEAWVYFIFGICDWLPTGRRMGKHGNKKTAEKKEKKESRFREICQLCLSGEIDDLEHLMHCPALFKDLVQMNETVRRTLNNLGLKNPSGLISLGERYMNRWFTRARRHFSQPDSKLGTDVISSDNLSQLVHHWIRNGGIEKGYRNLEKAIEERLHLFRCNCREEHMLTDKLLHLS